MYNKKIMEILQSLKNVGLLRGANAIGKAESKQSRDTIKFYFLVEEGNILNVSFKAFGGAYLIAMCSVVCDVLKGMSIEDIIHLDMDVIKQEIGDYPEQKEYYESLINIALVDALEDYNKKLSKAKK